MQPFSHWIFREKRPELWTPAFHLNNIRVDPSTYNDSDCAWALPHFVGDVIWWALNEQGYIGEELPQNAQAYQNLWHYLGGIKSSGHSCFAGNNGPDFDSWRRAAGLLGQMGLCDYQKNLERFIALEIEGDAGLSEQDLKAYQDACAQCDDVLYTLEKSGVGLTILLQDWLKAQDWIVVCADAPHSLNKLVPPHPLRDSRKAEELRIRGADIVGERRLFYMKALGLR